MYRYITKYDINVYIVNTTELITTGVIEYLHIYISVKFKLINC